jgi:hypothetical protein
MALSHTDPRTLRLPRPRRSWAVAAGIAVAVLALAMVGRSTQPYDPLAHPAGGGVVYDGLRPGALVTVIATLGSSGSERAVIVGAAPVESTRTRVLGIRGVTDAHGFALRFGRSVPTALGTTRPLAGLRFLPPARDAGYTHAYVAITLRIEQRGCFELPPVRLVYRVGSTVFSRLVDVPVGFSTAGDDHEACAQTLASGS